MRQPINLAEKLSTFSEHYRPRTVGEFNGHDLMVVKVKGPFPWHKHDETDDFFLVVTGRLTIQLRDPVERNVVLGPGELFVVPRGIEHRPLPMTAKCRSSSSSPLVRRIREIVRRLRLVS